MRTGWFWLSRIVPPLVCQYPVPCARAEEGAAASRLRAARTAGAIRLRWAGGRSWTHGDGRRAIGSLGPGCGGGRERDAARRDVVPWVRSCPYGPGLERVADYTPAPGGPGRLFDEL